MEKSAKSDVLGGAAAKIDVRGPEDAPALRLAALRKRDCEVLHPDFYVPAVEQITDVPARDAERIEHEVRDQADDVQHPQHQVEEQLALEIELESREAVELLRRVARSRTVLLSSRYVSYDRGDPALTDLVALLDSDVLVDNRAAHFRVAPDLAVVHHHGVVDLAIRMDEDRPAENRVAHEAARHDAAF